MSLHSLFIIDEIKRVARLTSTPERVDVAIRLALYRKWPHLIEMPLRCDRLLWLKEQGVEADVDGLKITIKYNGGQLKTIKLKEPANIPYPKEPCL